MAKHARISEEEERPAERPAPESGPRGKHAGGFSYRGDTESEYPDALTSLEPQDQPSVFHDEAPLEPPAPEPVGRHGTREKPKQPPLPPKSRRTRAVLIVVIVLVLAAFFVLGFLMAQWVQESRSVAQQQAQEQLDAQDESDISAGANDDSGSTEKVTEVPDLVSVLGLTQEAAIEAIGKGATVTRTVEPDEDDEDATTSVTLSLADEPADENSGTPTVYLTLDSEGLVIEAGYSAATSSLGFGTLSYEDAVETNHVIETTLSEAGVDIEEGSVSLPEDRSEYTTYAEDGTTVTKENCTFTGTFEVDGTEYSWSARLLYDYTSSNATGDLADTVRYVYVYVAA